MKKILILMLTVVYLLAVLCACSSDSKANKIDTAKDQTYIEYSADWPTYETAENLLERATDVFEGTVTDIFFKVIDVQTGKSVNSPQDNVYLALYSVYEIEVERNLKGKESTKKYIAIIGGIKGYNENEQIEIMQQTGMLEKNQAIPVLDEQIDLQIGTECLFAVRDSGGDYLVIPNPQQFAFVIGGSSICNKYTGTIEYIDIVLSLM